jgi:putative salt-induced outer membrane protein
MKKTLIAGLLLAAVSSFAVQAQDAGPTTTDASTAAKNGGWTGSGELGYSSATGNTRSQNLDAKLGLAQENEQWKNAFSLDFLRTKAQQTIVGTDGSTTDQFNTTANRYDGGASVGYKLDPRSYIVGAARYEHDEFGANVWDGVVSLGYGYIALKDDTNELSFEIGPGYKRYRPANIIDATANPDGSVTTTTIEQPTVGEVVARGLVNYKLKLTDNTAFEDTFLMEAGSKNTYLQNDAGLAVSMTKKMALKLGFQVRHNSDVLPGIKKMDTLTTTKLVYNF